MTEITASRSRRLMILGAATALAAFASTGMANAKEPSSQASASFMTAGCPGDGHISTNYVCTSLSNGALFQSVDGAIISAIVGAIIGFAVARYAGTRSWEWACLGAAIGVEVFVTLLSSDTGGLGRKCVVNHDLAEPFHTDQGLLNLALFVPIGLFAALAFRALAPTLALTLLVPVVTEVTQCLVPAIGRLCDTSDVEMNFLGGVVGAAMGWMTLALVVGTQNLPAPETGVRRSGQVSAGVLIVVGILWTLLITAIPVDATSLQIAGAKEKSAAAQAVAHAFGSRYKIANVQLRPGSEGASSQLLITLNVGSATLSWPDTSEFIASLESSSKVTDASFPVQEVATPPQNSTDAIPIATRYVAGHFPWGVKNSIVHAYPVGEKAQFGWNVSWRRRAANGVLMPMRLDVEINRGGRVSQLLARHVDDPTSLPDVKISKKQATTAALESIKKAGPKGYSPHASGGVELVAVERSGGWRVEWLIGIRPTRAPVYVDATTGKVSDFSSAQESLQDPGSMTAR